MADLINARTLYFGFGAVSLILSVCMLYMFLALKTYKGFGYWTIAAFSVFLGLLFISGRGALNDFISIILSNVFLVSYMLFVLVGLQAFTNAKTPKYLYTTPVIYIILIVYFTYINPAVQARIILFSGLIAGFCIYIGIFIIRHLQEYLRGTGSILAAAFFLQASFMLIRLVYSVICDSGLKDLMAPSFIHSAILIAGTSETLVLFFGLITLNYQRTEHNLTRALEEVKTLRGILPICSSCKKIRDDSGYWNQIESYLRSHSDVEFSHGICPDCMKKLYPEYEKEARSQDVL